ncbi:hypothetical protein F5Y09DRAFT_174593 [Xylaria sp. FL1042]|nr:hypothetical protein F5Y09DRAFT_174593 [Xylaria sp. FL1042]
MTTRSSGSPHGVFTVNLVWVWIFGVLGASYGLPMKPLSIPAFTFQIRTRGHSMSSILMFHCTYSVRGYTWSLSP